MSDLSKWLLKLVERDVQTMQRVYERQGLDANEASLVARLLVWLVIGSIPLFALFTSRMSWLHNLESALLMAVIIMAVFYAALLVFFLRRGNFKALLLLWRRPSGAIKRGSRPTDMPRDGNHERL